MAIISSRNYYRLGMSAVGFFCQCIKKFLPQSLRRAVPIYKIDRMFPKERNRNSAVIQLYRKKLAQFLRTNGFTQYPVRAY